MPKHIHLRKRGQLSCETTEKTQRAAFSHRSWPKIRHFQVGKLMNRVWLHSIHHRFISCDCRFTFCPFVFFFPFPGNHWGKPMAIGQSFCHWLHSSSRCTKCIGFSHQGVGGDVPVGVNAQTKLLQHYKGCSFLGLLHRMFEVYLTYCRYKTKCVNMLTHCNPDVALWV